MRRPLSRPVVRQVLGAALVLKGVAGAAVPGLFLRLAARTWVGASFEGASDLAPRATATGLYRDASLGTLVAGLAVLVRATRERKAGARTAPIDPDDDGEDAEGDVNPGGDDHDAEGDDDSEDHHHDGENDERGDAHPGDGAADGRV